MEPHAKYPHLFSPIDVGPFSLPNRVIMGSMHLGFEEERGGMKRLAAFYAERARAGTSLIVTGGISPNAEGVLAPFGAKITAARHANRHKVIPDAVHQEGGKILLQLLHGGRYSHHPFCVAPSAIQAPIGRFKPRALSERGVKRTIGSFVRGAELARMAGYDGVEIMGSEGYLINQFLVAATNKRTDQWGGSFQARMRFPLEIVKSIRQSLGSDFLIMFRLSMLDLVQDGSSWDEICELARQLEQAGVNVINTGIGWHEARIPTIASMVPHGGFAWVTKKLMGEVAIPLVTTNRFNMPDQVEHALASGCADLVSMARPFLADGHWIEKARNSDVSAINTCIGCNQACLDHIFQRKTASCLVNPRVGFENETFSAVAFPKVVLVVGGGPAGMSCALEAARRGHRVKLIESNTALGGQFNLASRIPGKEDFKQTVRYYSTQMEAHGVEVILGRKAQLEDARGCDVVVIATGVSPRCPMDFPIEHPLVQRYDDALIGTPPRSGRIAIIGSGGIGFDVADWLTHSGDPEAFDETWGIDITYANRGGMRDKPTDRTSPVDVHVFQRSDDKPGGKLGKTTGWIHRSTLKQRGVTFHTSVKYLGMTERGFQYVDKESIDPQEFTCDRIILCAGQTSNLPFPNLFEGGPWHLISIGGALNAQGVDAQRAIHEGWHAAAQIS